MSCSSWCRTRSSQPSGAVPTALAINNVPWHHLAGASLMWRAQTAFAKALEYRLTQRKAEIAASMAAEVGTLRISSDGRIAAIDSVATGIVVEARLGDDARSLGLDLTDRLRSSHAQRWIHRPRSASSDEIQFLLSAAGQDGARDLFMSRTEPEAASAHDEFLRGVEVWIATETDPEAILTRVCAELGHHLGVSRVGYGELDLDAGLLKIDRDWTDGVPSMVGRHPLVADSVSLKAHYRGEPVIARDMRLLPGVGKLERASLDALRIVASAGIPLMRDGQWAAHICAMSHVPRDWTDAEIRLIAAIGERTWHALAHASALARRDESEQMLRALVEHAPIGVYVRDEGGTVLLANRHIGMLPAPSGATGGSGLVERREGSGEGERWVLSTCFDLPTKPSSQPLVAGFEIDVTAQKRAERALDQSREALFQSEKLSALGALLAGVSHELNNPLSIVIAQSELLELKAGTSPVGAHARKVRMAAERCGRIVQSFLAMARQRPQRREQVDLNAVAANALELLAYPLRTGGVRVIRDLAGDLPMIIADPDHLHQVLTNLLINAQQAMAGVEGRRELRLRTALEPGFATIEISDSGPGIAPELRRRVFEPFFTTKPQGEGTGLGLSFSQGLIEAHGGTLTVEDAGPGATFCIRLPIGGRPDLNEAAAPMVRIAARTALVIDDEPDVADAIAEFLRLDGLQCDTAGNGMEAKRLIGERSYDVIVSDLRMPDMDGPALAAWLDANRPDLSNRIVFATGDTLSASAGQFLAETKRPFMEKPFTPDRLRTLVATLDLPR